MWLYYVVSYVKRLLGANITSTSWYVLHQLAIVISQRVKQDLNIGYLNTMFRKRHLLKTLSWNKMLIMWFCLDIKFFVFCGTLCLLMFSVYVIRLIRNALWCCNCPGYMTYHFLTLLMRTHSADFLFKVWRCRASLLDISFYYRHRFVLIICLQ